MSATYVSNYNETAVKPAQSICSFNNWVSSQGVFLGDKPLMYSLPLFLLEVSVIFLVSSATHCVLRRLNQSHYVSHLIAGIILGPSLIGRSKEFREALFPDRGTFVLDTISFTSLIFFLFIIGVKTDLSLCRKPGRHAIVIGLLCSLIPFILATVFYYTGKRLFPHLMPNGDLMFQLTNRLSITSYAVVADILDELKLLNTELGRMVMSAALITDIISWVANVIFTSYNLIIKAKTPGMAVCIVVSFIALCLFCVFVARPAVMWTAKRTPSGEMLKEGYFVALVIVALAASLTTEVTGFHALMGAFIFGLVLPGGMPVGVTMSEKLEPLMVGLFLPIYMVLAGYRIDFSELDRVKEWGALEILMLLCYFGKLFGSIAGAMYYKMPMKDALSVALMVNLKGVIEVSFVNMWSDEQIANVTHFSVITVSMMLSTALATPLIAYLYNPTARYIATKRRTVQHNKPHSPLRILAVVHNEDHVASILDLLEASSPSNDSPLSLTLLHLNEIVGHTAATLRPYNLSRSSATNPTASDRIVNAFRYFEQQGPTNAVTLHPFIAVSPPGTMHNDVCSLALDRKIRLILLPFHKHSDGAQQTANHTFQSINRNVLNFAPCSVGILVEHALHVGTTCAHTNSLLQRLAVYFFGGADDREALAYASRMAESPAIALTVVRFLPRDEIDCGDSIEWKMDEALLNEFRDKQARNDKVVYVEKVVEDGEGTATVIQGMSDKFDLLIVGRRGGVECTLTSGLSEWSECPELGIIGDMLASTEFNDKVSVLVVQQQQRLDGGEGGGGGEMVAMAR